MKINSLLFCLALVSTACAVPPDTIDDVVASLNTPFGGYNLQEEMAAFGRADLDRAPVALASTIPEVPQMGIHVPGPRSPIKGFFAGRWSDLEKAHGVMIGKWARADGTVIGHFNGVYGKSKLYKGWVFLGKYIDLHGYGRGLVTGRFTDGKFRGTWVDGAGKILGELGGIAKNDNHFAANWTALAPTTASR